MTFEVHCTLYFVLLVLCLIGMLFWLFYGPIKCFLGSHFTVRIFYRTVNRVVLDNDFYLINCFKAKANDEGTFHIDHIVIGDKYIYVIKDRYFNGTLLSNPHDEQWVYYNGHSCKYIQNPLVYNRIRADRLTLLTTISNSVVIPIVLINDDCFYTPFKQDAETGYFVSRRQLGKFIESKEAEDVPMLNPNSAKFAANDIARLKNLYGDYDE